MKRAMNGVLLIGFCALVGGAVAGGLWVVGGPRYARMLKEDRTRVMRIKDIAAQLTCVGHPARPLPEKLEDLDPCSGGKPVALDDPVSGAPFIYTRLSDGAFEICARLAVDPKAARRDLPFENELILRAGGLACFKGRTAAEG